MMGDEDEKSVNKPANSIQELFYKAIKESDWDLFLATVQNDKVDVNLRNDDDNLHPAILAFNTLINSYPNEDGKKIIFRLLAEKKIKLKGIVDSKDNNLLHQLFTKLDLFNYFFEGKDTKEIQNLIQLLIDKGTDINAQNKAGDTVLHKWLTLFGVIQTEGITEIQSALTQLLIDNKADNTIKNKFNRTPLESGTKGSKISPKQLEVMFENTKKLGVTTMQSAITAIEGNVAKNIPELNDSVKASQAAIEAFVPNYVPGILDDVKEGTTDKDIVIKDLALLANKIRNILSINPKAVEMFKEVKYQNSAGKVAYISSDYQTPDGKSLFDLAQEYGRDDVKLAIALEVYKTDKDSSLLAELCQEMGLDALMIALNKGFQKADADLVFYMIDAQGEDANLQPGEDIKNASLTGETIEPDAIEAI